MAVLIFAPNLKMTSRSFLTHFANIAKQYWTRKKVNYGNYGIVTPGTISEVKTVPNHINKPSYAETGKPLPGPEIPEIKNEEQILKMRESCRVAANILQTIGESIKIGQTTDELDTIIHNLIIINNGYPSPLNYRNFPKSVCTSINNVACHGIPDDRPLENGDIINVDITIFLDGYHGDCSKTFLIGDVDEDGRKLVQATEICLNEAIAICKPGEYFRSIGSFIQRRARDLGFGVVPAFMGHGIGKYFHGPPEILHIANHYPGQMQAGMTFTIEPVLTQGGPEIYILEDNWTAITADNARTAQFEHTVLITETGAEILTFPSERNGIAN